MRRLIATVVAALAGVAPAAAAAGLTVSKPHRVDVDAPYYLPATLNAIACPNPKLCFAADSDGAVDITHAPTAGVTSAWTVAHVDPHRPSDHGITALSCPAAKLCLAGDDAGALLASSTPAKPTGRWRTVATDKTAGIDSLDCPSAKLCVAADAGGNVLVSTDPRRGGWRIQKLLGRVQSAVVACAPSGTCVVAENYGFEDGKQNFHLRYAFFSATDPAAGRWRRSNEPDRALQRTISGLACPSASLCVATDGWHGIVSSSDPAAPHPSWRVRRQRAFSTDGPVSCPSAHRCFAAAQQGRDGGGMLTSTTPGTGPWRHLPAPPASFVESLTCPSEQLCLIGDDNGEASATTAPTAAKPHWTSTGVDGINNLYGVSCASAAMCVAVDDLGNVISTTTPGRAPWNSAPVGIETISYGRDATQSDVEPNSSTMYDLTCPGPTLCVTASLGEIVSSRTPLGAAGTWHSTSGFGDGSNDVNAISCPSIAFCLGVDQDQFAPAQALVSSNPSAAASSWTATAMPASFIGAIACTSPTQCIATDHDKPRLLTSTNVTAASPTWTSHPLTHRLIDLVCPAADFCAGIDARGAIVSSSAPLTAGSWHTTTLPAKAGSQISCPTSSFCVTVSSHALISSHDPTGGASAWTVTPVAGLGLDRLNAVSCPSTSLCVAVGTSGLAVLARPA